MKTYIPSDIKQMNRLSVLEYIRRKPCKTVTRPELSRQLHITEPTVLKITKFLQQRNILEEDNCVAGSPSSVGRRPSRLHLNPDAAYVLSAEYDGDSFVLAAIDMNLSIVNERVATCRVTLPELLSHTIPEYIALLEVPSDKILGLGLALPLAVDPKTFDISMRNPVIDCGDITCFKPYVDQLAQKLGFPVFMENDVNAAAYSMIPNKGATNDLIYMTFGFGVGAGILLDGKLRRGKNFTAGEFGYRQIGGVPDAILPLRTEDLFTQNYILDHFGVDVIEATEFSEDLIDHLANYIAMSICDYMYMLDIDSFMLSGFLVQKGGNVLLERIQTKCKYLCENPVEIRLDSTGRTVIQGMGALVFDYRMSNFLSD